MSAAQADLSANDPSTLLGDPSAASVPQIGIGTGGKSLGSRLGHLKSVGGDISKRGPRAPLSSQQRAAGRERLQPVRSQPASKVVVQQAKPQETRKPGLTAHGAPERAPREIPKTGKARDARDARRHGMSRDTRRFHEGMSAKAQDQFNKETRAHQDMVRRRLDDDIVESLRRIREEGLRMEREERYQRGKDEANARKMRETAEKLRRTDQQKEPIDAEGMFKARGGKPDEQP